jgi:hypothetical protein
MEDPEQILHSEETDTGTYVIRLAKNSPTTWSVKPARYILPNLTTVGARGGGYNGRWDVPVDDEHHYTYQVAFSRFPLSAEEQANRARGATSNEDVRRTKANRYLQDREEMKTHTFAGVGPSNNLQGSVVLEAAPIQDRTREHLAYGDEVLALTRKLFMAAIRAVQDGHEPPGIVRDPALNPVPNTMIVEGTIPRTPEWRPLVDEMERAGHELERSWRTEAGIISAAPA